MWVHEASAEKLATMIEHCASMKLVSGENGEIHYANAAFRDWSEYSLGELIRIGWKQLSVDNDSLTADLDSLKQIKDGYMQSYTIRKQYRTKSGTAHWGNLTALRYPAAGPIECFFCVWEPYKNGTSTAFNLAMDSCKIIEKRLQDMATELRTITAQTDEDRFVLGGIRLVQRNPKIAVGLLVMMLSIFGLNNIVELLQRTGLVTGVPVVVEQPK